jgi:hypothetical protein
MGLDVDQHGITAYPEYVISGGSPIGGKASEIGSAVGRMSPEMGRT